MEYGFSNSPIFKFYGKCGNDLSTHSAPIPKDLSFDKKTEKIQRFQSAFNDGGKSQTSVDIKVEYL